MRGRKPLAQTEIVVKVLDLIEHFGDGRPGILILADKWGVDESTVYRWSSYNYHTNQEVEFQYSCHKKFADKRETGKELIITNFSHAPAQLKLVAMAPQEEGVSQ